MRIRTNQSGFSVVELVIILAVVAILGLLGYAVHNRIGTKTASNAGTSQTASSQPATASDVASSPAINSASDLNKAAATLDRTDPSGSNNSDVSQLDSQMSSF